MPKIVYKAPSRGGIEATGTGITVVLTAIRQFWLRHKP